MRAWLLTLHLFSLASWLAGVTALGRVLAFHAVEPPSVRPTLRRIEARADLLFAWPGAILTLATGALLVRNLGLDWLRVSLWMQAKLGLVVLLLLIHLAMSRARRRFAVLDVNHPVARGWGAMSLLFVLASLTVIGLSVHRPFVGGR